MIAPDHVIRSLASTVDLVLPYDERLVNPASIDLRLGSTILIESAESPAMVPVNMVQQGYDSLEPYMVSPGQFILAHTLETVTIPAGYAAQFKLKSSRAREGLDHHLAGYFDPGYSGRPTLELVNCRQLHRVPIWPGMKIGQMVLFKLESSCERTYAQTGRYQGADTVEQSKG